MRVFCRRLASALANVNFHPNQFSWGSANPERTRKEPKGRGMKTVLCLTAHPGSASYVPVTSYANSAKALRADPHTAPTEF